jgi:hypothetical protein
MLTVVILNAGNGVVVVGTTVGLGVGDGTVDVVVVYAVVDVVVVRVAVAVEETVGVVSAFLPHETDSPANTSEETNSRASSACNVLEVFIICLSCIGTTSLH